MTNEQITSFVRQVLLGIGGAAVSKGLIGEDYMTAIVGVLVFGFTSAYGLYVRRKTGLIESAAAQPGVVQVQVTRATEDAAPSLAANPKVMSR